MPHQLYMWLHAVSFKLKSDMNRFRIWKEPLVAVKHLFQLYKVNNFAMTA